MGAGSDSINSARRWNGPFLATATVLIGLGTALQAAVNTKCSQHVGMSLWGAWVTFVVGISILTVGVAVEARSQGLPFLRWSRTPKWYHLLPGILGTCFVAGGVIVSSAVGASLFWIPLIVGQLGQSAFLDHFGLSTAGGLRKPLDSFKVCALLVAVTGAIMSVIERLREPGDLSPAAIVAYEVAALVVGAMTPAQAALSRAAAAILPSRLAAVWWSFSVGLVAISIAMGAQAGALPDAASAFPSRFSTSSWYMFTGGIFGVAYIATTIWWAPIIGSAPYFVALVCGQLVGSAAIDATGLLGSAVTPLDALRGVGIAFVMAAAAMLALGRDVICGWCCPTGRGRGVTAADGEVIGAPSSGADDDSRAAMDAATASSRIALLAPG